VTSSSPRSISGIPPSALAFAKPSLGNEYEGAEFSWRYTTLPRDLPSNFAVATARDFASAIQPCRSNKSVLECIDTGNQSITAFTLNLF
jgi:hypothetical protein